MVYFSLGHKIMKKKKNNFNFILTLVKIIYSKQKLELKFVNESMKS